MDKIKKNMDIPAPGDYKAGEAFKKTQEHDVYPKISKYSMKGFIDNAVKEKNFLPGSGHYKVSLKHYDILSKSPVSLRKRRQ